jgi:hypothetical protein
MRTPRGIAPIAELSPAEQAALAECRNHGRLDKQNGVWRGSATGLAINGNTIANLARDRLLIVEKNGRVGFATLTTRGDWFARALLAAPPDVME